eukprot:Skav218924  [mRNA]  locus=scaffold2031:23111:23944:+ [translate_table: standard]
MAEYFADLCDEGSSYNVATYTLFGYLMLRADESSPDRLLLPQARAALKGWGSRYPSGSRTGADPLIWILIALHMAEKTPLLAAAVLLQLDTYARPSEILKMRKSDVIRPSSQHCKFWGIIIGNSERDEVTKTGTQDDTVLLDSHDRAFAVQILEMLYNHAKSPQSKLFGSTTLRAYEVAMKHACQTAGLARFRFSPHSVRHSGPSIDSLQKSRAPEQIMSRGRWRTLKSIQRYQKPGQMLARMNLIPQPIWAEAKLALPKLLKRLKGFFRAAPPHNK